MHSQINMHICKTNYRYFSIISKNADFLFH